MAVVTVNDVMVGHLPRHISSVSLRRNGSIICQVTGRRGYSAVLVQRGLEVPYTITFSGGSKEIAKIKKLIETASTLSTIQPPSKKQKWMLLCLKLLMILKWFG